MVKWYARDYSDEIIAREFTRETEHCLFYMTAGGRERRENKVSTWRTWYPSWVDAHLAALEKAQAYLINAENEVIRRRNRLDEIAAQKKPA